MFQIRHESGCGNRCVFYTRPSKSMLPCTREHDFGKIDFFAWTQYRSKIVQNLTKLRKNHRSDKNCVPERFGSRFWLICSSQKLPLAGEGTHHTMLLLLACVKSTMEPDCEVSSWGSATGVHWTFLSSTVWTHDRARAFVDSKTTNHRMNLLFRKSTMGFT